MRALVLTAALLAFAPAVPACNDHAHGSEPGKQGASKRSATVSGVVREIDLEQGTIVLKHGRITSLKMQPMESMVFKLAPDTAGADLKPGDKVRFRAALVDQRPVVTEIALARR